MYLSACSQQSNSQNADGVSQPMTTPSRGRGTMRSARFCAYIVPRLSVVEERIRRFREVDAIQADEERGTPMRIYDFGATVAGGSASRRSAADSEMEESVDVFDAARKHEKRGRHINALYARAIATRTMPPR